MDIHRNAMMLSLLGRGVPADLAGMAADAVHPYAQLGDWPPDRRARREVKGISRTLAGKLGRYPNAVPVEELKAWTREAFSEYARIAGTSQAGQTFAQALESPELASATPPATAAKRVLSSEAHNDPSEADIDPSGRGGATVPSDTCLVCGGDTPPYKVLTSDLNPPISRGYYECNLEHESGELAKWWTHWNESVLVDREVILDPDMVGGGTTWSTIPVGTSWGDDLHSLRPQLRPRARTGPETSR